MLNKKNIITTISILVLIIIIILIFLIIKNTNQNKNYKDIYLEVKKASINYNYKLGEKYLEHAETRFDIVKDYKLTNLIDPENHSKKCTGYVYAVIKGPASNYKDIIIKYNTEIICSNKTIKRTYNHKLGSQYKNE